MFIILECNINMRMTNKETMKEILKFYFEIVFQNTINHRIIRSNLDRLYDMHKALGELYPELNDLNKVIMQKPFPCIF